MSYRAIQVGTGGQGSRWCSNFLPPNIEDGLIDIVAAVDVDENAHKNAKNHLGLSDEECYTDVEEAFENHDADICNVVVPSQFHEEVIDTALDYDAHILSEKPIADTLEGSVRIAEKVRKAGKKMGVTMSHRFDQDKTTLRRQLRSDDHGPIDYLISRFTCNCRSYGSWGAEWKYTMDNPTLIGGAIHHLDILADMADSNCETLWARTWNPSWSDFEGNCQSLVMMTFENGSHAFYEGTKANAAGLNGWGNEYIRAECRDSTLILDSRELEQLSYDPENEADYSGNKEGTGKRISLDNQDKWGNTWLIEQFVEWLDGGEPMPTNVEDNLQSVAMVFAAIQSSETDRPIQVQDFLQEARERVEI